MSRPARFVFFSASSAWSPMLEFGRSSLFVYWIHVELVYGVFGLGLAGTALGAMAWLHI